jgi:hypothetical protein
MFQTKAAEKIKTHTVYVQKLYSENRIVYEIMWKNMVQPVRPHIKYNTTHGHCKLDNYGYTHTQNM